MSLTKRRFTGVLTMAALAFGAAACGGDDSSSSSASSSSSSSVASSAASSSSKDGAAVDYKALSGTLNGTGASFPDPYYQKVITDFAAAAPNVKVSYTKSGSSAGRQDLQNKTVQFAGSDSLVKDEDRAKFAGEFIYVPTVAAPITISYKLSGVDELKLDADTLAKIFQTEITTWNDPAIVALNDGVQLPSTPIVVIHRSDGSGTTNNFTKYLKKAAADTWKLDSGDTVQWPASAQGAEKNSGVASLIAATDGAVGYIDLADSVNAGLSRAEIKNKAGKFVKAQLPQTSAALAGADIKADLSYDPLDAAGDDAYPITAPTWLLVYKQQPDAATAEALKGFLTYILTDGQKVANTVGYAQLPEELATKALALVNQITAG